MYMLWPKKILTWQKFTLLIVIYFAVGHGFNCVFQQPFWKIHVKLKCNLLLKHISKDLFNNQYDGIPNIQSMYKVNICPLSWNIFHGLTGNMFLKCKGLHHLNISKFCTNYSDPFIVKDKLRKCLMFDNRVFYEFCILYNTLLPYTHWLTTKLCQYVKSISYYKIITTGIMSTRLKIM